MRKQNSHQNTSSTRATHSTPISFMYIDAKFLNTILHKQVRTTQARIRGRLPECPWNAPHFFSSVSKDPVHCHPFPSHHCPCFSVPTPNLCRHALIRYRLYQPKKQVDKIRQRHPANLEPMPAARKPANLGRDSLLDQQPHWPPKLQIGSLPLDLLYFFSTSTTTSCNNPLSLTTSP